LPSESIPGWQLAIRFGLEVASLVAIGRYAGGLFRGLWAYAAAWGVPLLIALLWATFAVKGDPSRSGNAPVPIPGLVRLALEMAVFLGGAAALAARNNRVALAIFLAAFVLHHSMTTGRLTWLLRQ
jgi:Protein of unknown function (DUF2568)